MQLAKCFKYCKSGYFIDIDTKSLFGNKESCETYGKLTSYFMKIQLPVISHVANIIATFHKLMVLNL